MQPTPCFGFYFRSIFFFIVGAITNQSALSSEFTLNLASEVSHTLILITAMAYP